MPACAQASVSRPWRVTIAVMRARWARKPRSPMRMSPEASTAPKMPRRGCWCRPAGTTRRCRSGTPPTVRDGPPPTFVDTSRPPTMGCSTPPRSGSRGCVGASPSSRAARPAALASSDGLAATSGTRATCSQRAVAPCRHRRRTSTGESCPLGHELTRRRGARPGHQLVHAERPWRHSIQAGPRSLGSPATRRTTASAAASGVPSGESRA